MTVTCQIIVVADDPQIGMLLYPLEKIKTMCRTIKVNSNSLFQRWRRDFNSLNEI